MTITVEPDLLQQLRTALVHLPEALGAIDTLEACEGDLEDAAISVAIEVGQEPDVSDRWIEGLAKRWRHIICQPEMKVVLQAPLTAVAIQQLASTTRLPLKLATLVALYVQQAKVQEFCYSFEASWAREHGLPSE
ncbi:MAG: hypothetical protein ACKO24_12525 [Leptolyngbyaceae cyanobacterium]